MNATTRLLAVGPLPPPYSGTTVSFDIFCKEVHERYRELELTVIDTSQKRLKKNSAIISTGNLTQAVKTVREFAQAARHADLIIIFGSNGFLLSLMPTLMTIAKSLGKPCFVRPFGGSLDNYVRGLNSLLRSLLMNALKTADGLIVETELLRREFAAMGVTRTHYVPGYRPLPELDDGARRPQGIQAQSPVELVFVGHVRREKGVFTLLEALKLLDETGQRSITCTIYGPIYSGVEDEFHAAVQALSNVVYGGVLQPEQVIQTVAQYDILVFPTFYQGEGHPGVVIEAMMAGLPVITTDFRAIPEVVEDGKNGILVPPEAPEALYRAIMNLAHDSALRTAFGAANRQMRTRYDAEVVVPELLQILCVPVTSRDQSMMTVEQQ